MQESTRDPTTKRKGQQTPAERAAFASDRPPVPSTIPPAARPARRASPRRDLERRILDLATRQHGVVTRPQLGGLGLSAAAVARRVAAGRLAPLHRGVYRLGPAVAPRAPEIAAVLACGDTATLSHASAADLLRIVVPERGRHGDPIDVTVEGAFRRRAGVRVHRVRRLTRDEVTRVEGIPVTTPARTIIDLAASLDARSLERAVAEAVALRGTTSDELRTLAGRYARRPGVPRLRALLGAAGDPARTRSRAEERFLELVAAAHLPRPEVNIRVGRYEVDCVWREQRLIVEIDGFAYHSTRASFEADRRRDVDLARAGFTVIRVTWRQLADEPFAVVGWVAGALGRGSHREIRAE